MVDPYGCLGTQRRGRAALLPGIAEFRKGKRKPGEMS